MRDFLTGIAIILIVVLTTILVAPYFVDWNGQRDFLEARLTHALGQKVTVGGTIDLKLLPTPYLVLDQVVVGGDEAPIRIGVRHLNLELAVAPLLHGEFDIVEARLHEPTIRVGLEPDHTLPPLPAAPAFSADVRFDRVRISDGTLAVSDPGSGHTFVLDHVDVDAEAGSFAGPFKIAGAGGAAGHRTNFRLSTGAAKDGRVHARFLIDETAEHAGADFDGTLDLRDGRGARQSLDGKLALAGHVPLDNGSVAWKLSGPLLADTMQARLDGGELRLGGDEAGLTLQADARIGFGMEGKAALDLQAKQLDIDRLAGAPTDTTPPPPPQLPDLAQLRGALVAAMPSMPTDLHLSVEGATYAGETLSNIELRSTLGDAATHPLMLAIDGPGGSHLAADGTFTAGAMAVFSGNLDGSADDLPRLLDWTRSVAPTFPWTGHDARFAHVKATGVVKLSQNEATSNALSIELDRTRLSGKARLTYGSEQRPKLVADLASDALDLDSLPSFESLRSGTDPFDLALKLDAKAVKVSHVGDGGLDTGALRIDVEKTGDRIALHDLRLTHLGGAMLVATGDIGPERARLSSTLDAERLDATASLVRQLVPGVAADALVARAPALVPAKLKIDASFPAGKEGRLSLGQTSIVGTLGATNVDASAKPDADHPGAIAMSTSLRAPDGAVLLRQLGVSTVPIEAIGASRLSFAAHGRLGEPLETKLDASFGATKVGIAGRYDFLSVAPGGSGSFTVQSSDLTPLLEAFAIAFPDMTDRMPAEVNGRLALDNNEVTATDLAGRFGGVGARGSLRWRRSAEDHASLTGDLEFDRMSAASLVGLAFGHEQPASGDAAWSRQPLAVGLVDPPRAALSLKSKVLDVGPGIEANDAKLELAIAPDQVTIRNVAASLWGGRLEGDAKLRRDGRQATIEGKLALGDVHVQVPGTLDAKLTAKLDFAGGGTSALALMSSLAGSGDATAANFDVSAAGPKALVKIFDDVESDVLAVDQDAVVRAYNETSMEPLKAGTVSYGLQLATGVVHFDPRMGTEDGPATSKVDVSLDLPRLRLATHVEETLKALPKNWSGPAPTISVTLQGPLGKPSRSVDVSGFLNVVAARALARESARIEAYELDLRERAFFNERLQSESRREEERRRAEDDAREAEAERKAKAEAARQDRMRKEQAAKAARDAQDKAARDEGTQGPREQDQEPAPPVSGPPLDPAPAGEPRDPSSLGRY